MESWEWFLVIHCEYTCHHLLSQTAAKLFPPDLFLKQAENSWLMQQRLDHENLGTTIADVHATVAPCSSAPILDSLHYLLSILEIQVWTRVYCLHLCWFDKWVGADSFVPKAPAGEMGPSSGWKWLESVVWWLTIVNFEVNTKEQRLKKIEREGRPVQRISDIEEIIIFWELQKYISKYNNIFFFN
jgi:hypothetical protein